MIIIGDPGSCHMGNKQKAFELVSVGADCGLDKIKFQLFKNIGYNINLPYTWMPELIEHGKKNCVEVFASVWDFEGMRILHENGCKSVKFSYSQKDSDIMIRQALCWFDTVYVSGNFLHNFNPGVVRLFCVPEYPVLWKINFFDIFEKFDGFSDHTLGYRETVCAVLAGAQIIEKHFTLDDNTINCPDHCFALKPKELEEMCIAVRRQ